MIELQALILHLQSEGIVSLYIIPSLKTYILTQTCFILNLYLLVLIYNIF